MSLGNIRAVRAAFIQQWRSVSSAVDRTAFLVSSVPIVAVLAWIARTKDDPLILAYVSLGSFMMVIWNSGVFRVGWSLTSEINQGTFELSFVTRTPLILVMFGKSLALIVLGVINGSAAFFVALAIGGRLIDVDSIPLLLVSLLVSLFALTTGAFIFAPLMVLSRGRGGFFNAFIPFGFVFSGFLYPISVLPQGLEQVARLLPTSWAMDAVLGSVDRTGSVWNVAGDWGAATGVSVVWLLISYLMFRKVDERLRISGVLGTY